MNDTIPIILLPIILITSDHYLFKCVDFFILKGLVIRILGHSHVRKVLGLSYCLGKSHFLINFQMLMMLHKTKDYLSLDIGQCDKIKLWWPDHQLHFYSHMFLIYLSKCSLFRHHQLVNKHRGRRTSGGIIYHNIFSETNCN